MVLQDHLFLQNLLFLHGLLVVTDAKCPRLVLFYVFTFQHYLFTLYTICLINKYRSRKQKTQPHKFRASTTFEAVQYAVSHRKVII